jgi:hypothetical protein
MNKKILYIYILAILGLILTLYYIWFRFIRERIPRDIPFMLTPLTFFCLCCICLIYIYVLYRMYRPRNPSYGALILYQYSNKIFKTYYFFDKLLKKNTYINKYLFNFYFKCIKNLKLYETKINNKLFIIFIIMPKIIILCAFIIDIFYFNKFYLFYYALILGLLSLCYIYSLYSIKQYLTLITHKLDKYYFVKILSTKEQEEEYEKNNDGTGFFISLSHLNFSENYIEAFNLEAFNLDYNSIVLDPKYFINLQSTNLIFDFNLYEYTCIESNEAREYYSKRYNIKLPPESFVFEHKSDEISKLLAKEFHELMPQAYYFQAFVETHTDLVKINFFKFEKYFITGYLICWLYILGVSIHTLNIRELIEMLNATWEQIKNPFIE